MSDDGPTTVTMRAVTENVTRGAKWWEKLPKWKQVVGAAAFFVVGFVGILLATSAAIEKGKAIWEGFQPLEGTMNAHLRAFEDHKAEDQETHEHFMIADSEQRELSDSVLKLLSSIAAKADTTALRLRLWECEVEGVTIRECIH